MSYIWYKDNRRLIKSLDKERQKVFGVNKEYFDGYIAIHERYERQLSLHNVDIDDLGELKHINGGLSISHTKITSLGKLETIEGNLSLYDTNLTDLGNLERVSGTIYCIKGSTTHELLLNSKFKDKTWTREINPVITNFHITVV